MLYHITPKNSMVEIACCNYGFDCKFKVNGNTSEVIEEYQKHTLAEHGIEYSIEVLNQSLLRMKD